MWAVSSRTAEALRSSNRRAVSLALYNPPSTSPVAAPVLDRRGSNSYDADQTRRVRWTGSLTMARTDPAGVDLRPLIVAERGPWVALTERVYRVDGSYEDVPFPPMVVTGTSPDGIGGLSVKVSSFEQYVEDNRFVAPTLMPGGVKPAAAIATLVSESLPAGITLAGVVDRSGSAALVPTGIVVDRDRGQACDDLAAMVGCTWYLDRTLRLIVEPVATNDQPPVGMIDASASGVLLSAVKESSRARLYNAVSAAGTDVPARFVVYDERPGSPTRWGGPIGRKVMFYASPFIGSAGGAETAARSRLNSVIGGKSAIKITTVPSPCWEPGDVIDVILPDRSARVDVIDKVTHGFPTGSDGQDIETRSSEQTDS